MNQSVPITIVPTGNGGFIVYEQKDVALPPAGEIATFLEIEGRYGKCLMDFIRDHFKESIDIVFEKFDNPLAPPMAPQI